MSNPITEQFSELNKAALDQWIKFSQLSIENIERFSNIGICAAKESLENQVKQLQNLPSAKDAQGWAGWRQKAAENQLESVASYARKIYEATTATQQEVGKVLEEGVQQYQKNVNAWVDTASRSAPAGSEVAINALKNGISAGNAAIDGFQKATRQAAEVAEAGVKAAVSATLNTVKQAQQHATQTANSAAQHFNNTVAQNTAAATTQSSAATQSNKKAVN